MEFSEKSKLLVFYSDFLSIEDEFIALYEDLFGIRKELGRCKGNWKIGMEFTKKTCFDVTSAYRFFQSCPVERCP